MKTALGIIGAIILLTSCQQSKKERTHDFFEITVEAKEFPDSIKVLLYNRDIDKNIDSAYVINEHFQLTGNVDIPSLCYLNFYDKSGKEIEPYNYFYLDNEKVHIEGTYKDFFNAEVTGSQQTELLKQYKSIGRELKDKANLETGMAADSQIIKTINKKYKNLIWEKQNQFLFDNANNQMSVHQILYRKKKISKDNLIDFYNKLDSINANSIQGKELYEYATTVDVKIGDEFRDIIGVDLQGKQHKLSDYSDNVILLDFWGSGCIPCRKQNKSEFRDIWKEFKSKDFKLISFSLDEKRKYWEKASIEDQITWINISDLKGLKSKSAKSYAITAIPNSFLIDKNGIVAKSFIGFRAGENRIGNEIRTLLE